jgi:cytochrome c oxidase subunit 2
VSALAARDLLVAGTAAGGLFVAFVCAGILAYGRARDQVLPVEPSSAARYLGEGLLWVVPAGLCALVFLVGVRSRVDAAVAPADATPVSVVLEGERARFDYGDGVVVEDALRVPAERPVLLTLRAVDATLVVPILRLRVEARSGHDGEAWFVAPPAGEVGLGGVPGARLVSLASADFDKWLADAGGASLPPAEYGRKLYARAQCQTCHSLDGSIVTGPSFKGLFGKHEVLADGREVVVDAAYVRESLLDPGAKVVRGFQPVMPPFAGQLDDKQIAALTAFIEAQKP